MNLQDEFLEGRFEETEEGVLFPREGVVARGFFVVSKRGEPDEYYPNLVVNEGLNYMLGAAFGATSVLSSWYIALFTGNVTVQASWTAANFAANATEWTNYDSATRVAWSRGSVASGAVNNFASKGEFGSTGDGQTIRGAALLSDSAKSAVTGKLMAAARFGTDKGLDTGEILDVGYGFQLTAV